MVGELVLKLGEFALQGAEVADKMGKMAQSANVPVESFSRLAYAARLSHLSTEDLGVAMKKLNVNIAEAAIGSDKQAGIFKALGVSVKDAAGATRGADAVMADLAEKFSQMEEGPAKAALAVELFGKAGTGMLPFLNEGKEGLKKLSDEADRFGVTLSTETVASATEFVDNLERMKTAVQGVATRVAGDLSPALRDLTDLFLKSDTSAEAFKETARAIAFVLKGVTVGAVEVAAQLDKMVTGIFALKQIAGNLAAGNLSGAIAASKNYQAEIWAINQATAIGVERIWKEAEKVVTLPEMDFSKKTDPTKILQAIKDNSKEARAAMEAFTKSIIEAARELDLFNRKQDTALKAKVSDINSKAGEEHRSFSALGQSPSQAFAEATAGFKAFDDALKQSTYFAIAREEKLTEAAKLHEAGAFEQEAAARDAAEELGKMSQVAGVAKQAFFDSGVAINKLATDMKHSLGGAIGLAFGNLVGAKSAGEFGAAGAVGNSVAGSMGKGGQVLGSAMQGAQAGGIWGALIAAVAEIVKDSEGFQKIIHAFDRDLKQLGDAIGGMFAPLGELVDAIQPLTSAISGIIKAIVDVMNQLHGAGQVGDVLKPIMGAIMKIIEPIMRIIKSLGDLIGSLGIFDAIINIITPIFDLIGTVIGDVLGPVVTMLGRVFQDVGDILKPIINLISSIGQIIGAVLAPLQGVFSFFDAIIKIIDKISGSFGGLSLGIKIFSTVINAVSLVLLGISDGIMRVWEGITKAFRDMFADFAAALGGDNTDAGKALNSIALSFSKMNIEANAKVKEIEKEIDKTVQAIGDTWDPKKQVHDKFHDAPMDKAGIARVRPAFETLAKMAEKTAASMSKLSEAFTNVPSGFKTALRTWQATDAVGGAAGGAGAAGGYGGPNVRPGDLGTLNVTIMGSLVSEVQLSELVKKWRNRDLFRQKGTF